MTTRLRERKLFTKQIRRETIFKTYWPSTEQSIKRCTFVTAKQVHPVEDIGISPWPVDVVEFGADAYGHWKQVDVRQLYNQVPQTPWVSLYSNIKQFYLKHLRRSYLWRSDPIRCLSTPGSVRFFFLLVLC